MTIRTVFMGSPDFAIPVLRELANMYQVIGVITQPDRPAGRGRQLTPPPVKNMAIELGIPVIQPEKLKDPQAKQTILDWNPDLIVVAAFGQILRPWVLDLPKYGCINVHGSLLPRWRGASPIQAAILNGDDKTGITIMKMDPGIDTGDMLTQADLDILPDDTTETLSVRMAELGAQLLVNTLPDYLEGKILPQKQDERMANYAGMIKVEDALLDPLTDSAVVLERKVRAYQPWPAARLSIMDMTLIINRASTITCPGIEPGLAYIYQKKPAVGTTNGLFVLEEVQPAGKKTMPGKAFLNGVRNWGTNL
jgi:methionyl-tRNA formyltransferase